eukprot:1194336-Prorocentrum_minimum.AAC.4
MIGPLGEYIPRERLSSVVQTTASDRIGWSSRGARLSFGRALWSGDFTLGSGDFTLGSGDFTLGSGRFPSLRGALARRRGRLHEGSESGSGSGGEVRWRRRRRRRRRRSGSGYEWPPLPPQLCYLQALAWAQRPHCCAWRGRRRVPAAAPPVPPVDPLPPLPHPLLGWPIALLSPSGVRHDGSPAGIRDSVLRFAIVCCHSGANIAGKLGKVLGGVLGGAQGCVAAARRVDPLCCSARGRAGIRWRGRGRCLGGVCEADQLAGRLPGARGHIW